MTAWLLTTPVRRHPRLWVENLWLLESREPLTVVRQIDFHPGLNIVWAREPETTVGSGYSSAGHGVGKTSLCLLLRYCLGDEAQSIAALRDKALAGFPKGGVAAKVHVDGVAWIVCRPYADRVISIAGRGEKLEDLLAGELVVEWSEFSSALSAAFIETLPAATLPGSQQPLEWRHLLAWCIRDQKTRFDHFFHWRDGDGLGFRRPRQDPPRFVQTVLGLIDTDMDWLLREAEACEEDIQAIDVQRTESATSLAQVEAFQRRQLERLLKAEPGLPVFEAIAGPSLQSLLNQTLESAEREEAALLREIETAEFAQGELSLNRAAARHEAHVSSIERARAQSLLDANQAEYERLSTELQRLENLQGRCQHGDVEFSACAYILNRRNNPSLPWRMDMREAAANRPAREAALKLAGKREEVVTSRLREADFRYIEANAELHRLGNRLATSKVHRDYLQLVWNELSTTVEKRSSEATGTQPFAAERATLEQKLTTAKSALLSKTKSQSARTGALKTLTRALAFRLLGEAGYGRFVPDSDDHPFELALGGEAYQVLEVLLGDLTCLLDAALASESHHPGFLVHDCPREADMSEHLYREYLMAAAEAADLLSSEGAATPFQYIVTTTSAPPTSLQTTRHVVLELLPGAEEYLLFKRRLQPQLFE